MRRRTDEFRIARKVIQIDIAVRGQNVTGFEISVPESGSEWAEAGVQPLFESQQFVPVKNVHGTNWELLSRDAVRWIGLSREGEPAEFFDSAEEVEIELEGGEKIVGHLLYSAPTDRSRVSDLLNNSGRFLPVWQPTVLCLVNKSSVIRVVDK